MINMVKKLYKYYERFSKNNLDFYKSVYEDFY